MLKNTSRSIENIYTLNGSVPVVKAIPFGLQHILAMFVANIAPILIVGNACSLTTSEITNLVQCAMIMAGIGTLIQLFPLWKIGSGLPIVMGISFTFVGIFCSIGPSYGYGSIIGAVMIGGIVEGVLGLFARYWRKIISPIVAASVVTAIGFSLLPVGASSFGGGSDAADFGSLQNLLVGFITLLSCLVFQIFAKSYLKQLSVLFGLVVGYIFAACLGVVDFSALNSIWSISFPHFLPFTPEFHAGPVLTVIMIFLVSATETIGDTSALAATALDRDVTDKEITGSLACDGFISSLSALVGCMPITSFSQNVGLIAMTKVINRFTIATGAVIMILAGFFPVIGALLNTLPDAVLGGCTIMMFGNIVVSGLQMISNCGFTQRNITIAALSLSVGIGFTQVPQIFHIFPEVIQNVFAENCVATVFLVAIIANLVLPKEGTARK